MGSQTHNLIGRPAAELAALYRRDLTRLSQQIESFPSDESLWQVVPGITNPAGNLVLHIEGNLREYVGRQLGNIEYRRHRPEEFAAKEVSKAELLSRIDKLKHAIPSVIEALSEEALLRQYPEIVLQRPLSTQAFLVHLFGHLGWHVGQIDYLRRMLTGNGAIEMAGL